jgi:phospholipase C
MKLVCYILSMLIPCAVPAFAGVGVSGQAVGTAVSSLVPTVTISANPTSITKGSSSILTVTASNATGITITGTNGSKRTMASGGGTVSVSPTSTTTYTATATGSGGTSSASVTITVGTGGTSDAPTVTISANPTSITKGSSSSVTVTATNATGITITGTNGSKRTLGGTGGTFSASPTSTTTYTATATGSGGTSSASVTITVGTGSGSGGGSIQLTVASAGTGGGTVTSSPAGIDCPGSCTASFPNGTVVVLTATPENSTTFAGWSGLCTGIETCRMTMTASTTETATFEQGTANLKVLNHIVFFAQENRSLDNYFGAMRKYWNDNGIPDQSFDGLPQFNPTSGQPPLYGPPPAIPGCDPTSPYPGRCIWDTSVTVASFHMISVCNENTSPSWQEAHNDWDYTDPVGTRPAKNNGFVHTAAGDARLNPGGAFYDTDGIRAMGYWDGKDLNYDYFMASNFATSDRFFHPVMSRTELNREYLDAATTQGYALPNGSNANDMAQLKAKPIFQELQNAGISWKFYINPDGTGCAGPPYDVACLLRTTDLNAFTYSTYIKSNLSQHIATMSDYFTDLQNGTLPQVAEIYAASDAGLDQHGSDSDAHATNVQSGARYTAKIINALMQSSSWHDSAFIFTFDESGGLYDHVAPQPMPSPDGIPPVDLPAGYICTGKTGPICDFTYTGYRIPLTVISPYAKKNYVSHTVMDSTAILKFIENRFNLPALTKRDAAQPDMSEFFDFNNPQWTTPPIPPIQNTSNPCYLDRLP